MSSRRQLKEALKAAASLRVAGELQAAREALAQLQSDPDIRELGQMTSLGLPRTLVSAQLKLAKAERDIVRRVGYQYHLVPETGTLERYTQFDSDERRRFCQAQSEAVPRCIHQIWIGDQAPPLATEAWRAHARQQGYDYRLWREDDLQHIGLEQLPLYRHLVELGNLPGAVDVARYFLLQQRGGIYLDCDWYPARNDLGFHDLSPMTGLAALAEDIPRNTGKGGVLLSNAVLLSPPGHPVFSRLLSVLDEVVAEMPGAPVWWTTGPLIFTLMARGGPVTLADAGLVAGSLPQDTAIDEVQRWCRESQARDGGLLLAWKSWIWELG
ncbi:glycosyltransferase family 32 protein [Granulosicoccus sp. 3-233]|uniref:glycosyltransferase family 32 protein n=1 Tax=Granulosicoccus sp. 3-233 TaxID=3417969 RepID=UPI003D345479